MKEKDWINIGFAMRMELSAGMCGKKKLYARAVKAAMTLRGAKNITGDGHTFADVVQNLEDLALTVQRARAAAR